jgi:hypothetical protein
MLAFKAAQNSAGEPGVVAIPFLHEGPEGPAK